MTRTKTKIELAEDFDDAVRKEVECVPFISEQRFEQNDRLFDLIVAAENTLRDMKELYVSSVNADIKTANRSPKAGL